MHMGDNDYQKDALKKEKKTGTGIMQINDSYMEQI